MKLFARVGDFLSSPDKRSRAHFDARSSRTFIPCSVNGYLKNNKSDQKKSRAVIATQKTRIGKRTFYRYAFFYIAINAGVNSNRKKRGGVYRSTARKDGDFAELEKQKV